MLRRPLARSDLDLSIIGFGCWAMGGLWWGDDVNKKDSIAAVHAALSGGINWFDTAPLYGYGHADEVLREALGARIHDVIIATKVGVRWDKGTEHVESDLSPTHLVEDVENSLRRLGVDCIDLLQIHWPCERGTPLAESIDTLERLRSAGKIRWFGLCNYEAEDVRAVADSPGMVSLQTPYSLVRRELEGPLLDAATNADPAIGVLAYEPLCRGLLTGKFDQLPHFPTSDMRSHDPRFQGQRFQHARGLIRDLSRAALKVGVPVAALSIGWVCKQPGLNAAIVGAKRPEQVLQNLQAAELMGRTRLWRVVDEIAALHGGYLLEQR